MKYGLLLILPVMLLGMACKSSRQKTAVSGNMTPPADTAGFYPLADYFKDQVRYVDLRNFPIYRIETVDGKRDSTAMSKEEFAGSAGIFLQRSLSEPGIKIRYKETIFEDLSTGSITLNYTPLADTETVRYIDILLDNQTRIVKRIFIRSTYQKADTLITEQCNWKASKSFQINRTLFFGNGKSKNILIFINWNDKPQADW